MADLGVEVKLEPKLDRGEFEAALNGLNLKLPVQVDAAALQKSITQAISSINNQKINVDVNTAGLSKKISGALNFSGVSGSGNAITKSLNAQTMNIQRSVQNAQRAFQGLQVKGLVSDDYLKSLGQNFTDATAGIDRTKQSTEQLNSSLKQATGSYQRFSKTQKEQAQDKTAERRLQRESQHLANIQRQARELIQNNPRVQNTNLYGQLQGIVNRAMSGSSNSVELSRDLANVRAEMERLGVTSETVGQRIRRLFGDHMNTAIAMAGLHLLQNTLQDVVQQVVAVDTAMTDLQKVSNATSTEYASFLEGAEGRAKSLGATITDVIGATSEFSRLGYNLEESSTLGDAAVKYLNVSEYTNIEDAAQSIVSTMQAFDIEADNVGTIVDKMNAIGQ